MAELGHQARTFTGPWIASWSIPAIVQITLSMWLATSVEIGSPIVLFWIVAIAASLCVVASAAVIARSFRRHEAELGFLGLFFYSVSALPLVHGITTPGVIFEANTSTMTSVLLSIPVGLVSIAPAAVPRHRQFNLLRRHWRAWVVMWLVAINALAIALLIDVDLLPSPTPRQPFTITVAILSFLGCVLLSRRHLRMARIAGRPGPLVVSLGCGFVGSSAFVWLSIAPFSTGFWSAHALDIVGVLSATVGALVVYHRTGRVREVLAPVLVTEPLGALEIGLDPLVHRFVADLETKDRVTRDHVVRTAELAVLVGEELRLGSTALRRVGLTALLHDVGKLEVPDAILNKPGRLTDAEFDIIRRHTVNGERLIATSAALGEIAAGVRGHHERMDGGGYPDGLAGDAIPHDARVVAVCDAFDAMANTRQYRDGMGHDKAIAVLNEHAGSQWDPIVVAALVTVIRRLPKVWRAGSALDGVGRSHAGDTRTPRVGCDCLPEPLLAGSMEDHPTGDQTDRQADGMRPWPAPVGSSTPTAGWRAPTPDGLFRDVPGFEYWSKRNDAQSPNRPENLSMPRARNLAPNERR